MVSDSNDKTIFENVIRGLEADILNAGAHLAIDATARQAYIQQIKAMADELRSQVISGKITWGEATFQAQETRNIIMVLIRDRSTPVGRAMAEKLKFEGKTLNELIAKNTERLYGSKQNFHNLSIAQRNTVYAKIIESAGRSNAFVTARVRNFSYAGRGLVVLSIGLSVYTVMTAKNKIRAVIRELTIGGAGIVGGIASGSLAGVICGSGAPVCVTAGAL